MKKNRVYAVYFDIRNFAYVCPADHADELPGAYMITSDQSEAQSIANSLNANRGRRVVCA